MEDENLSILQNIEAVIVSVYRSHPELTDFQVDGALESLGRTYHREKIGGGEVLPKNDLSIQVYQSVKTICEWRLGRQNMVDQDGQPMHVTPITVDEIQSHLKRIRKSISLWNKKGGTRGYLDYVTRFLP